jgi:putative phosphoesterase
MRKIGLLSDTHGYLDEKIFGYFKDTDEIWHAGDFGSEEVAGRLQAFKPLRAVYGNVDGNEVRAVYPETIRWNCEEVSVMMTHIGGYPPKYNSAVLRELQKQPPMLFICGHSHILKIVFDEKLNCLHINPGAAGKQGWHLMRTAVRFTIDGKKISNCEVIELGKRTAIV